MFKEEIDLALLYEDLANYFSAASQLFAQLNTPERVHDLLRTLAVGDQPAFDRLVASLNLTNFPLDKCVWVRELVLAVITTSTPVEHYYLRNDLTSQELWVVWQLSMKFRVLVMADQPITEGEFLKALKSRGLVARRPAQSVISTLVEMPGVPHEICL